MGGPISQEKILWFFLGLFLASIFLLGWLLWPFVSILILGFVITGFFAPVFNGIREKTGIGTTSASLLTCSLIFLLIFLPIVLFVGVLSKEAYELYLTGKNAMVSDGIKTFLETNRLVEMAGRFLSHFQMTFTGEDVNRAISEMGKGVGLFLYRQANAIAANLLKFVVNFFLLLLVVFFLLIDGRRLISFVLDLSPLPRDEEEKLFGKFKDMAGAILLGNGLCGLIQGIAGGLLFWIFGLKSPFLWGVVMGLLAFLPIVGIGVVLIPAAGYLILSGRIGAGVFFIVFYGVLSGGVEYILKPKIVGGRVQMHTLLVFFAIMGGLNLFGILGIIYGPLIVTAFLTLTDIYHANYQKFVEKSAPNGCN